VCMADHLQSQGAANWGQAKRPLFARLVFEEIQ